MWPTFPSAVDKLISILFSYKAAGANHTDEHGHLDTVEFLKCVGFDLAALSGFCVFGGCGLILE